MSTIQVKYSDGKTILDVEFEADTWQEARQKEIEFFDNKEFDLIQRVLLP